VSPSHVRVSDALLSKRLIDEKELRRLISDLLVASDTSLVGVSLSTILDQAVVYMMHANMLIEHVEESAESDANQQQRQRSFAIPALELELETDCKSGKQLVSVPFRANMSDITSELDHHRLLITMATDDHNSYRNVLSRLFANIRDHTFEHCRVTMCRFHVNEVRVHFAYSVSGVSASSDASLSDSAWLRVVSNGLEGSQFAVHFACVRALNKGSVDVTADSKSDTTTLLRQAIIGDCMTLLLSAYARSPHGVAHLQKLQCVGDSWYQQYRKLRVSDALCHAISGHETDSDTNSPPQSVPVDHDSKHADDTESHTSTPPSSPAAASKWRRWCVQHCDTGRLQKQGWAALNSSNYNLALLHTAASKLHASGFPPALGVADTRVRDQFNAAHNMLANASSSVSWVDNLDDTLEVFEVLHMALATLDVFVKTVRWEAALRIGAKFVDAAPFISSVLAFVSHLADLRRDHRINITTCKTIAKKCQRIARNIGNLKQAKSEVDPDLKANRWRIESIDQTIDDAFETLNGACEQLNDFVKRSTASKIATAQDDVPELKALLEVVKEASEAMSDALTISNGFVRVAQPAPQSHSIPAPAAAAAVAATATV
jgi:hypothetical protein